MVLRTRWHRPPGDADRWYAASGEIGAAGAPWQTAMQPRVRRLLRLVLTRTAVAVAIVLTVLYLTDEVSVSYRRAHAKANDPVEVITIRPYYAVPLKSGKTEVYLLDAQRVTCVHTLFSHFGYSPCWLVQKKADQPVPLP